MYLISHDLSLDSPVIEIHLGSDQEITTVREDGSGIGFLEGCATFGNDYFTRQQERDLDGAPQVDGGKLAKISC